MFRRMPPLLRREARGKSISDVPFPKEDFILEHTVSLNLLQVSVESNMLRGFDQ